MPITPYQLAMMTLENPDLLVAKAAAAGIEPPETPEEAVEKLKDPSLAPGERERLQGIASGIVDPNKGPGFESPGQAIGKAFGVDPEANRKEQFMKDNPESRQGLSQAMDPAAATPAYMQGNPAAGMQTLAAPPQPAPAAPALAPGLAPGMAPQIPQAAAPAPAPQPQLAPLTQQLMMPQAPAAMQPPAVMPGGAAPVSVTGLPPGQAAPPVAPPVAEGAPGMDTFAKALAGLSGQVSTGGAGNQQRAPGAVSPQTGSALQPQTLGIVQWLAAQGQTPKSLAELLAGR